MEETTISAKRYILVYGIILGGILIASSYIRYLTDSITTQNLWLDIFEIISHVFIIVYCFYLYKRANAGYLKLWKALKIGFSIVFIGTIIKIFWDVFFLKVISPDTMYELIQLSETPPGNETVKVSKNVNRENHFLFNISLAFSIVNLILGTIISLLAGAIMQKNKNPF